MLFFSFGTLCNGSRLCAYVSLKLYKTQTTKTVRKNFFAEREL